MPTFSVIIPTYNSERFIAETVDSVRRQSIDDWELIVVDDGSTDGTAEIIADLVDSRIQVHRQANAGGTIARQNGFLRATAEWVIFLDHDDRLMPDAFARYVEAIAMQPEAVAHYGERVLIDRHGWRYGARPGRTVAGKPEGDVLYEALALQFITTVGQVCVRAQALVEVGGFPSAGDVANDWALWCLLATAGPFHHLGDGPVLEYRRHSANMGLRILDPEPGPPNIDGLKKSMRFIFDHERIRPLLSPELRRRCWRKREANCYRFKGVMGLRAGAYAYARRYFWEALKREPGHFANIAGFAIAAMPPLRPLFNRFAG